MNRDTSAADPSSVSIRGRFRRALVVSSLGAVAALALAGCASGGEQDGGSGDQGADGGEKTPVTVFAAASLQGAFDELAAAFEEANPEIDIQPLVTDGSNVLVSQIQEGATPDILATADERTMADIEDAMSGTAIFATNTLVIATPAEADGKVSSLADLADPDVTVVLCAPEVPCGAASQTLLDDQGVEVTPASEEQNVTAVLTKVESGVADAGLVYRTDVVKSDVTVVDAEGADDVVNRYPIGVLSDAPEPEAAQEFVDFITGADGQAVLESYGFGGGDAGGGE
ncbi:MAG: molybdate ABC transporter substrate-binding protein [Microbacterium sp.]